MSTRFQIGSLTLALTLGLSLTTACEQPSATEDEGNRTQAEGTWWGKMPNGTGVYIGATKPLSEWGILTSYGWFYMTGFTNGGPSVAVNGGYFSGSFVVATGRVISAELGGIHYGVKELAVKGSELVVTLIDLGTLTSVTYGGDKLAGLRLHVGIPRPGGKRGDTMPYSIFFKAPNALESVTKDVFGYELVTQPDNIIGAPETPFCLRNDFGGNEPAQLSQGAQWDPMTAARTDNPLAISTSCASGGIGRCEQWGYRPWDTAPMAKSGVTESLVKAHQACIYMKRADYCATGDTYTVEGTQIGISDAFDPAFQKSGGVDIEAVWGSNGALCLNTQRHPDLPAPAACLATLPACAATTYASDWYVQSELMH